MSPTLAPTRLTSDARRDHILNAALHIFAERGFHGATTRELAKAAGVSEALMFRHFPTKEDLYAALQTYCCQAKQSKVCNTLSSLDDSTASLAALVHLMIGKMLRPAAEVEPTEQALHRLLANSFLEDGVFARGFMAQAAEPFIAKLEACLRAAIASGEATATPVAVRAGAWFVQHLAAMLMLNEMPGQPVIALAEERSVQVEQAVWFALLGLGVEAEAIRRHYRPQTFSFLMG